MINFNKDDFLKLSDKDKLIHIKPIDIPHLRAADFNYESPITIDHLVKNIAEESANEIDKLTYKAIMQVGVRVDKEELIKALTYDRNQYNKGFEDGFKAALQVSRRCSVWLMIRTQSTLCLHWQFQYSHLHPWTQEPV